MKRKALIIANPGESGAENYCAGVVKDVANYVAFLCSALGGGWHKDEITVLERPSASSARFAIQALKDADYSFSVFSGHGYTDAPSKTLRLELRAGHLLAENELRQGALKHTVVFDCCRVIATSTLAEDRMMKAMVARADINLQESRKYFERGIEQCPKGVVAMFACSPGETAGDDSRSGGYYSSSLIIGTKSWSDNKNFNAQKEYYLFSVVSAHQAAEALVHGRSSYRQNPNIEKPRSDPYFPFAVVA